jgi:hypothetical protein
MKTIVKPFQPEEVEYYNDFTGQIIEKGFGPSVKLKINFSYGSRFDGANLSLDLDDKDAQDIMEIIKNKLSEQTKSRLKKYISELEEEYEDAMDMRSWDSCDLLCSSLVLYRYLLNVPGFEDFCRTPEYEPLNKQEAV